ncbi:hypothetical protein PTTG_30182 [Puccinia triticina 1-1 BBBD Race 1]|uniref:Carboxyl_trans domain-containing protein n=1 Tax=Puccinia triticina (isolate 1-1 / race 1 (BBBD)) TaxID=630390 RepID=A0A180FZT2_PUCT1|nr:hypothetical protein PTTG_30182 [Puccinia triticina 1-1 BBBD Race 1]
MKKWNVAGYGKLSPDERWLTFKPQERTLIHSNQSFTSSSDLQRPGTAPPAPKPEPPKSKYSPGDVYPSPSMTDRRALKRLKPKSLLTFPSLTVDKPDATRAPDFPARSTQALPLDNFLALLGTAVLLIFAYLTDLLPFTHYVLALLGTAILLIFAYLTDLLIDLLTFTFLSQMGTVMIVKALGFMWLQAKVDELNFPSGRRMIVIANNITFKIGSFGPAKDDFFYRVTDLAQKLGVPRIYLSANSGARLGIVDEVTDQFCATWNEPWLAGRSWSRILAAWNKPWLAGRSRSRILAWFWLDCRWHFSCIGRRPSDYPHRSQCFEQSSGQKGLLFELTTRRHSNYAQEWGECRGGPLPITSAKDSLDRVVPYRQRQNCLPFRVL